MKLSILSESPADEAALRVLAEAALGGPFSLVMPALRARGWPSVEQVLPAILRYLHFRTDADGLLVTVDSDDSPIHTIAHEAPGHHHPLCRICRLRHVFRRTLRHLPPAHGRTRPLRAVGVAVPAIEAWYLCGRDASVTEAAWQAGQEKGAAPYTRRELKLRVYGTERPSLPLEIRVAVESVSRHRGDLRRLENDFPRGFGAMSTDLQGWKNNVDNSTNKPPAPVHENRTGL